MSTGSVRQCMPYLLFDCMRFSICSYRRPSIKARPASPAAIKRSAILENGAAMEFVRTAMSYVTEAGNIAAKPAIMAKIQRVF